ncbi:PilN domain-containing protein [Xanthobacter oligotrophicus]|uniref:PilN domain-containing protein n=1 Tax=Xanthobacter oligotrophicus TaxID=2607286 RepID=UPI0011F14D58|nr:PilN domain-containing protein [Xanthobacter oligotrophicus]MCG5234869.1 PilN domain-containing protein [Xanthobacter oligotrophicus]
MTQMTTHSPSSAVSLARLLDAFSVFIDLAAGFFADLRGRLTRGAPARLVEGEGGVFTLALPGGTVRLRLDDPTPFPPEIAAALKGREVELALDPGRFLFRPLELPRGAAAFLDGIVRSQIDRLTPWSATEAAYGFTAPQEAPDDRLALTVAATARARISPLVERLKAQGVGAILVTTQADGMGAPIRVLDHAASGAASGAAGVRRILLAVLGGAAGAALLALAVSGLVGGSLDADLGDITQRIAAQRRAMVAARDGQGGAGGVLAALERRKREVPAGVLVLEALSQVLPDDTYVTELQIEGDKVEVTGVSREAAALIRLLEQSRQFAEATFVAPTTRAPGEAGERFQISARVLLPMEVGR